MNFQVATWIHFDWALENNRDSEQLFDNMIIYYTLLSVSNSTQNSGKGRDSIVWSPNLSHNLCHLLLYPWLCPFARLPSCYTWEVSSFSLCRPTTTYYGRLTGCTTSLVVDPFTGSGWSNQWRVNRSENKESQVKMTISPGPSPPQVCLGLMGPLIEVTVPLKMGFFLKTLPINLSDFQWLLPPLSPLRPRVVTLPWLLVSSYCTISRATPVSCSHHCKWCLIKPTSDDPNISISPVSHSGPI